MRSNKQSRPVDQCSDFQQMSSYFMEVDINVSSSAGCNQIIVLKCEYIRKEVLTKISLMIFLNNNFFNVLDFFFKEQRLKLEGVIFLAALRSS